MGCNSTVDVKSIEIVEDEMPQKFYARLEVEGITRRSSTPWAPLNKIVMRSSKGTSMFILSNIYDRRYKEIYPNIENVIFDICDKQLINQKNADWTRINPGDVVCIIKSTRKLSTFYRVVGRESSDIVHPVDGRSHVLVGEIIAKAEVEQDMESLFNRFGVRHPYLPNNKFSIGFNVADLGDALDTLPVKSKHGKSLGEVEKNA